MFLDQNLCRGHIRFSQNPTVRLQFWFLSFGTLVQKSLSCYQKNFFLFLVLFWMSRVTLVKVTRLFRDFSL